MSTLKDRAAALAEPPEVVVLRRARALLATPERWCHGANHIGDAHCLGHALYLANGRITNTAVRHRIFRAMGDQGMHSIPSWNDAPGRTHAEVLALLDRAIAGEGPQP